MLPQYLRTIKSERDGKKVADTVSSLMTKIDVRPILARTMNSQKFRNFNIDLKKKTIYM